MENLKSKLLEISETIEKNEKEIGCISSANSEQYIKENVMTGEYVLFCGAGISIPGKTLAPSFIDLRNTIAIALADTLHALGIIDETQQKRIDEKILALSSNASLNVPPELLFSYMQESLGFNAIYKVLSCLDRGEPNYNHTSIVKLAKDKNSNLKAIVTTNFDLYIEKAFAASNMVFYESAFILPTRKLPLFKPHGSLDDLHSIQVTLDQVMYCVENSVTKKFKELVQHRTILIIGYSGWDYDLFPLLVYAGKHWGTKIVWVLFDEFALNEQVVKLKLSLPDSCVILNSSKIPLLATISGTPVDDTSLAKDEFARRLIDLFVKTFAEYQEHRIILALISVIEPFGLSDSDLMQHLCEYALHSIRDNLNGLGKEYLSHIMRLSQLTDDSVIKRKYLHLGLDLSRQVRDENWEKKYKNLLANLELDEDQLEMESARFNLNENFYPRLGEERNAKRALQSLKIAEEYEIAEFYEKEKEFEKALSVALEAYDDYKATRISDTPYFSNDPTLQWDLHRLLADIYLELNSPQKAQEHLYEALSGYWDNGDYFELSLILSRIIRLYKYQDRALAKMAASIRQSIPRITRDVREELLSTCMNIRGGFGSKNDYARVQQLFEKNKFDEEDTLMFRKELDKIASLPTEFFS